MKVLAKFAQLFWAMYVVSPVLVFFGKRNVADLFISRTLSELADAYQPLGTQVDGPMAAGVIAEQMRDCARLAEKASRR